MFIIFFLSLSSSLGDNFSIQKADSKAGKSQSKIRSPEEVESGLKRSGYPVKQERIANVIADYPQLVEHIVADAAFMSSSILTIRGYGE